jgi:hypothetical protein
LVINFIEMVERPLPFSLILPVENFLVGLGKERQNLEVNSFHAKNIGDKRPDFAFPLPSQVLNEKRTLGQLAQPSLPEGIR